MSSCDVPQEILVGIDWADKAHAFEAVDPAGKRQYGSFEQSQAGVAHWLAQWLKRFSSGRVLIAVEATRGALINALMDYRGKYVGTQVYKTLKARNLACHTPRNGR